MSDTVQVQALSALRAPLVLVVEDDPEIAALMRDFLAAEDFRVELALDARQAGSALGMSPDCVLLDVMLPDASGFDLCRDIRARSDVPVLFLTARDGTPTRSAAWASVLTTTSSSRRRPPKS